MHEKSTIAHLKNRMRFEAKRAGAPAAAVCLSVCLSCGKECSHARCETSPRDKRLSRRQLHHNTAVRPSAVAVGIGHVTKQSYVNRSGMQTRTTDGRGSLSTTLPLAGSVHAKNRDTTHRPRLQRGSECFTWPGAKDWPHRALTPAPPGICYSCLPFYGLNTNGDIPRRSGSLSSR